jgi:hypothetical protein
MSDSIELKDKRSIIEISSLVNLTNNLIIKDEDIANSYETMESVKKVYRLISAMLKTDTISDYTITISDLRQLDNSQVKYSEVCQPNNIPTEYQEYVLNYKRYQVYKNYLKNGEINQYYRNIYENYVSKTESECDSFESFLNLTQMPFYARARLYKNFSILYAPTDILSSIELVKFKDCYNEALTFFMQTSYNYAYEATNPQYNNVCKMVIVWSAIKRYLNERMVDIDNIDFYDEYTIRNSFLSYGLDYFFDMPLKYQKRILKNVNYLIRNKGTNEDLLSIIDIFGFKNIKIMKYYLCKEYNRDVNNNINIQDPYMQFYGIDMEIDEFEVGIHDDNTLIYDYEDFIRDDKYWFVSKEQNINVHEYEKLLKDQWNYIYTKYISVNSYMDLSRYGIDWSLFLNYLYQIEEKYNESQYDDGKNENNQLYVYNSVISTEKIKLIHLAIVLIILISKKYHYKDIIIKKPESIMRVYDFNPQSLMDELLAYTERYDLERKFVEPYSKNNVVTTNVNLIDVSDDSEFNRVVLSLVDSTVSWYLNLIAIFNNYKQLRTLYDYNEISKKDYLNVMQLIKMDDEKFEMVKYYLNNLYMDNLNSYNLKNGTDSNYIPSEVVNIILRDNELSLSDVDIITEINSKIDPDYSAKFSAFVRNNDLNRNQIIFYYLLYRFMNDSINEEYMVYTLAYFGFINLKEDNRTTKENLEKAKKTAIYQYLQKKVLEGNISVSEYIRKKELYHLNDDDFEYNSELDNYLVSSFLNSKLKAELNLAKYNSEYKNYELDLELQSAMQNCIDGYYNFFDTDVDYIVENYGNGKTKKEIMKNYLIMLLLNDDLQSENETTYITGNKSFEYYISYFMITIAKNEINSLLNIKKYKSEYNSLIYIYNEYLNTMTLQCKINYCKDEYISDNEMMKFKTNGFNTDVINDNETDFGILLNKIINKYGKSSPMNANSNSTSYGEKYEDSDIYDYVTDCYDKYVYDDEGNKIPKTTYIIDENGDKIEYPVYKKKVYFVMPSNSIKWFNKNKKFIINGNVMNNSSDLNIFMDLYINNNDFRTDFEELIISTKDYELYRLLKIFHQHIFTGIYQYNLFPDKYLTYTDYIKEKDVNLYNFIVKCETNANLASTTEEYENVYNEFILEICDTMESYFDDEHFEFLIEGNTFLADFIKDFILELINFVKAYTVQIKDINSLIVLNDKFRNQIRLFDEIGGIETSSLFAELWQSKDEIYSHDKKTLLDILQPKDVLKEFETNVDDQLELNDEFEIHNHHFYSECLQFREYIEIESSLADVVTEIPDGWFYLSYDNYIRIIKYTGEDTIVTVPTEIDGIQVKYIDYNAFANCTNIEKIIIPEGITIID